MSETYAKPLPRLSAANTPYLEAAREGRLVVQRCQSCGKSRFPAASLCSHCLSPEAEWITASGKGTVWSFCFFHRQYFKGFEAEIPYNVVLVQLDEGPRLYSNLLGVAKPDIRVGMRVKAHFDAVTDEVTLVKFVPLSEGKQ